MTIGAQNCICGNSKAFDKCCGRFLASGSDAKTPEQLMRSRYSAYAHGGYGEYLLETWLPVMTSEISAAELSIKQRDWFELEVLNKSQKGDDGFVEFKAYFKERGEVCVHHERSTFKRNKGKWYYVGGELE